ncbi:hypothetical protein [Schlesneria sp. T3-172]|uniref:hypothetical protein n=1 Tax=Schlesneria sphaerica TaxID=3373610 RepID=UPI0037CC4193
MHPSQSTRLQNIRDTIRGPHHPQPNLRPERKTLIMVEVLPGYDAWKLASPEDCLDCEPLTQMNTIREFDYLDKVVTPDGTVAKVIGCEWCEDLEERRYKVEYKIGEDEEGEAEYDSDWYYESKLKLA